ncbi:MAG TPA: DUF167 family protein [Beijerinckiaceae bacterium]|jgi:hypothetical protein
MAGSLDAPAAALPWRADAGGVTVAARLTPRADRDAVEGITISSDGRAVLLARVRAVPENGKANDAARRLLAAAAGVPASSVELVAGATARLKTFRIAGEPGAVAAALERAATRKGHAR